MVARSEMGAASTRKRDWESRKREGQAMVDRADHPTWLVWLLAAGLAIGAGLAAAIRRRPARRTLTPFP
jgi:hypothetical protein